MPNYSYKAKSSSGEIITGKFDAADKNMVVSLLKSKGLFPIDITEIKTLNKEVEFKINKKITLKDLAIFCREFYTLINAGVSLNVCLDLLKKQTENAKLAKIVGDVSEKVQKGMSLSEALKSHSKVFPAILISMVEIGEISGTLDVVLNRVAIYFEKEEKIKNRIKTALAYPIMIAGVVVVILIFMLTFVVPSFIEMFNMVGGELPKPTQILLAVSDMFKNIWFLMALAFVVGVLIYLYKRFRKTEQGRLFLDGAIIKLPLIGKNIRKILTSRFTRSLSLLLQTGVPLVQAIEVLIGLTGNQVMATGLVKVKEEIKRGSNLAGPLEMLEIFPTMVTQMISVGEESGTLDVTIDKVADFYDDELESSISKLISMIEPAMMLVMAVIVGSIVVAMMMPIFQMQQNMGKMY